MEWITAQVTFDHQQELIRDARRERLARQAHPNHGLVRAIIRHLRRN